MNGAEHSARIVLIDDDQDLGSMLTDFLKPDRLELTVCGSGEDGLQQLATDSFDLVILDIMLPGISGLDALKEIRRSSEIPVIMLTARGDDVDRIIGLEFGADDYLAKPFNPRELRRSQAATPESNQLRFGKIELDPRTRRARFAGNALRLTGTEYEILKCLLESPGEVVSKEQLSERALGRRLLPYDRSIDTHISNLRGKLDLAGGASELVQNQRGVGYLLLPGD
jgi:two-component system response regulator CpxR